MGKHSVRHYKDKFIKISQKIYFVYLFFRVSGTNVTTTISGQDVIENPNEVWKTICQRIEEDPENGDRYDEAVSKK